MFVEHMSEHLGFLSHCAGEVCPTENSSCNSRHFHQVGKEASAVCLTCAELSERGHNRNMNEPSYYFLEKLDYSLICFYKLYMLVRDEINTEKVCSKFFKKHVLTFTCTKVNH